MSSNYQYITTNNNKINNKTLTSITEKKIFDNFKYDKWCLHGAFIKDDLLNIIYDFMKRFSETPIKKVIGNPPCLFSLTKKVERQEVMTKNDFRNLLIKYKLKWHVSVGYNFNNPFLTEEDLKDNYSNYLLHTMVDILSFFPSFVYVASPILLDYIKKEYHTLRIGIAPEYFLEMNKEERLQKYLEFQQQGYMIMLAPSDVFDMNLIAKLDASLLEIVVNDNRKIDYPYLEHCKIIDGFLRNQFDFCFYKDDEEKFLAKNNAFDPEINEENRPARINYEELGRLRELGVVGLHIGEMQRRHWSQYIVDVVNYFCSQEEDFTTNKAVMQQLIIGQYEKNNLNKL